MSNPHVPTYKTMAAFIAAFVSHHPTQALAPTDAISLGVLASLANDLHGNNRLQQWKDIQDMAGHAINILEDQQPQKELGLSISNASEPEPETMHDRAGRLAKMILNQTLISLGGTDKEMLTLVAADPSQARGGEMGRIFHLAQAMGFK